MRLCFSCREVVDGPAIVSEGRFYHPDHFCCDRCKQPVGSNFHVYKVWRLCSSCVPRPVCSSNQCSQPDRRIGHSSGNFYRFPMDARLEAFHSCHTVRCSVCGRGVFWAGSPADSLAYHLRAGRPTCTRCYYRIDVFDQWQRPVGSRQRHMSFRSYWPPLPTEFATNRRRIVKQPQPQPQHGKKRLDGGGKKQPEEAKETPDAKQQLVGIPGGKLQVAEKAAGKKDGKDSGKKDGKDSGKKDGKDSGKKDGKDSDKKGGKDSGKKGGKDSGKTGKPNDSKTKGKSAGRKRISKRARRAIERREKNRKTPQSTDKEKSQADSGSTKSATLDDSVK